MGDYGCRRANVQGYIERIDDAVAEYMRNVSLGKKRLEKVTSLDYYLQDISRYPILMPDQEFRFFSLYRDAKGILADADPAHAAGEADEYSPQMVGAAERLRDVLVTANLKLVILVAKEQRALKLSFEDRINEGNHGLLDAVERFKPELGYKFASYAPHWIRQKIRKAAVDDGLVRYPWSLQTKFTEISWYYDRLSEELSREPSIQELANFSGKTREHVLDYYQFKDEILSLNVHLGDDTEMSMQDMLSGDYGEHDAVEREFHDAQLLDSIQELDEREREILICRAGGMPIEDIGGFYGLSRERVRQLQGMVFRRLHGIFKRKDDTLPHGSAEEYIADLLGAARRFYEQESN